MFWGCFSYDHKGPCHIWESKTAAEKKESARDLDALNARLKPEKRAEWELNTGMRRMGLRNKGGPKPQWRFTADTGKVRALRPSNDPFLTLYRSYAVAKRVALIGIATKKKSLSRSLSLLHLSARRLARIPSSKKTKHRLMRQNTKPLFLTSSE